MNGFSIHPGPGQKSLSVRHTDYPHKAAIALIAPSDDGTGTLSLIPVVEDHPPAPLTGRTVRFSDLGAVADHLGVAWTRAARAA